MVKPDRATLEEFIEGTYGELYGREVTPEEMDQRVAELETLYKKAYRQSIRNFRGETSTAISPEDEFRRSLKESGEGKFARQREDRRSMHQYMGN
nr:hypothetical protein [Desulfobacterales bacterium]NIV68392.1 hypothetical protein [Candidatus Bathyarchaeota archaeon]